MVDKLLCYGMGPGKLCDDLNGLGFPITFEDAKKLYNKYVETYSSAIGALHGWGSMAAKYGYMANSNGRRRYWDLPDPKAYPGGFRDPKYRGAIAQIEREGGNFMIQSVNADMTKLSMVGLREYRKKHGIRTEITNQVYDEIVTHTHADDSPGFSEAKRKIMIEAASTWLTRVPMGVDGHIGPHWHKD